MPKNLRKESYGHLQRAKTSKLAYTVMVAIQDESLEYMVGALALVVKSLELEKNISMQDAMTAAGRMIDAKGLVDDNFIVALRSYVANEIPNF